MTCARGTTNSNARGNTRDRAARRAWLVETYRADRDLVRVTRHFVGMEADTFYVDNLPRHPMHGQTRESMVVDHLNGYRREHQHDRWDEHSAPTEAEVAPACRCYRCGVLLSVDTVTADRIIPGCRGGTYRRNNLRPACARCNSETGGALSRRA